MKIPKLLQRTSLTLRALTAWQQPGFSLVEMAVVLIIVGTLLGGMMMPLAIQMEQQKIAETRKTLETAKEALLVYAAANGRLPCPASNTSNGAEDFGGSNASVGGCANPRDGFLPAVTLGLSPVDSQGYMVDGWGLTQNRIRYAVFTGTVAGATNPFTAQNGMRTAGMTALAATTTTLFNVCRSNSTVIGCGGANNLLTQQTPAIVFSLGKNATTGGTSLDEAQNLSSNDFFVSHEMSSTNATNGEFDDMLNWISLNGLFGRMMTAGSLP